MIVFDAPFILGMVAAGAFGVLAMLWVLAKRFGHERRLHDLRIEVHQVRKAYAQRLAELAAREHGEA
jgi:hypothetical protein